MSVWLKEVWSQDLQGDFSDFDYFQASGGFGFYSIQERTSSLAFRQDWSIMEPFEIEIAMPAYQRQGLAKILGAQMICEAQKRSLFPLWDAHNEAFQEGCRKLGLSVSRRLSGL